MSIGLGVAIYAAVKPVLKIYVILLVGFLLAKYNLATVETSRGVSNMVVNAILPCLTFNKIVGSISAKDIKEVGVLVLTAVVMFVTGGACAYLTKWMTKSPKQWFWGLLFAGIFPNISDLPIAYVQSMSNGTVFTASQVDRGVAYCCIFLCTQSFMLMNFGMFRLVGLDFREPEKDVEQGLDNESSDQETKPEQKNTDLATSSSCRSWDAHSMHSEQDARRDSSDFPKAYPSSEMTEKKDSKDVHHEATNDGSAHSIGIVSNAISSLNSGSDFTYDDGDGVNNEGDEDKINDHNTDGDNIRNNSFINGSRRRHSNNSQFRRQVEAPVPISTPLYKTGSVKSVFSSGSAGSRSRTSGRRRRSSQTIQGVINEYSAASRIKSGEMDLNRPLSLTQEVGEDNAFLDAESDGEEAADDAQFQRSPTHLSKIDTAHHSQRSRRTSISSRVEKSSKFNKFVQKYKIGWLVYIAINFCRPASLGALLGIICSMIPWVKALFVHTYVPMHQAPDGQPVLNFLMDFTGYIGNACVPMGLLLLGGTLARLEVQSLPPGFWKTTVVFTIFRLVVLPIIGIAWANKLYDINWLDSDIAKFVVILTWAMPSATAQVYFTAFYTPLEGSHVQMDCLSILFLSQYGVLFITLSVVVSYALKADLKV
ncbi:LAFA_0E19966g1_1 [Lachancea sp. 'fantastica']|nr:LAFA_0E19966g1_1 [Lachancea sp. 'fantastica']